MTTTSDIPNHGWVAGLPQPLRAWARLSRFDRPKPIWLLLLPCWWGLALVGSADALLYLAMAVGAVVMRGAGCTINDIVDRDIDGQVARTATRPLPAGEIGLPSAVVWLGLQLLAGFLILLSLGATAIGFGVASLLLVVSYPFMKRIIWWPQAVLGLAFNWGALLAPAAVLGPAVFDRALPILLLYLGGMAWTLGYDTIYAHQDKDDDARIGVKSTARRLGARSRGWIAGFYAVAIMAWGLALLTAGLNPLGLGVLAVAALGFVHQVRTVVFDDPASCGQAFRANTSIGWLVLAAFGVSAAL